MAEMTSRVAFESTGHDRELAVPGVAAAAESSRGVLESCAQSTGVTSKLRARRVMVAPRLELLQDDVGAGRGVSPRRRDQKGRMGPAGSLMIAIMWQFDVKAGREQAFEELYGVEGPWTTMNRHTRSYIGTSFLRDQNRPARYLVIEYWSEMLVAERDQGTRKASQAALEATRDDLVASVEPLGVFTALDVPDRFGPAWSQR
jgi:hypothetical protein